MMYFPLLLILVNFFIIILLGIKLFEVKRAKKTLQRLIDHTYTGYYKYRYKDGVVVEANDSFVNIMELDMKKEDVIGRSLSELIIYVEDEESIRERIKKTGALISHEYPFKTLKGRNKWVIYDSYMIKDPRTNEEMIEVLIKDITDEKSSYEEMREAEERYRKLFKNSGDMVIIYKFDSGIIEEVNPVTEIITGFSSHEIIGRSFDELFHPTSRKELKESHKDLMFKGSSHMEGIIVCENGSYKETSLTLSMFEFKNEKIVMAVIKDISELVRGRKEQDRRKKELEDFWKASIEREERIKDLRKELQVTKEQIKLLMGKNETGKSAEDK